MLPLILAGVQLKNAFTSDDPRKVIAAEAIQTRAIDRTTDPIKPFQQPLITVTFDDGWESIYTDGLPLLQKHGIPTTQYVLSGVFADKNYMTVDQIKALRNAGHEIACHSVSHADLAKLPADALQYQLQSCKNTLEHELGTKIIHFASPYGSRNAESIAAIKQTYRSHRNTNGDITTNGVTDQDVNTRDSFQPYDIHAITIRRDTTVAELQQAIDFTVRNNGWLVLNYHDVEEGSSTYGLNSQTLDAQLAAISRAPARVVTLGAVMDAITPQTGTY